eukprot:COSAG02_NODE_132_length_34701_cov_707.955234_18_plen_138_part_00
MYSNSSTYTVPVVVPEYVKAPNPIRHTRILYGKRALYYAYTTTWVDLAYTPAWRRVGGEGLEAEHRERLDRCFGRLVGRWGAVRGRGGGVLAGDLEVGGWSGVKDDERLGKAGAVCPTRRGRCGCARVCTGVHGRFS